MTGLTQSDLAEQVGISVNFLSSIEGAKKFPSPKVIDRFAESLGLPAYQLFVDWDLVNGIGNGVVGQSVSQAFLDGLKKQVVEYSRAFFGD